jgi:hypothetical protein
MDTMAAIEIDICNAGFAINCRRAEKTAGRRDALFFCPRQAGRQRAGIDDTLYTVCIIHPRCGRGRSIPITSIDS